MRIALAHPYRWPEVRRGGERYLDDLTRHLRGAGHDVDVIVSGPPAAGLRAVPRLPAVGPWTDLDLFGLAAAPALARRYDVVHALVPSAAVAARALGHRVVYTLLGEPTPEVLARSAGRGRLLRRAITGSTAAVAYSAASAARARELTGRDVGVLPPGVDLTRFPLRTGRSGPPTVLHAADLSVRRKGLDVLVRACARLRVRLLLAGPGDPTWALAGAGEVEVLGPLGTEALAAAYARAHVTCLPAAEEAFGIVLVESLATGTPVVAGHGAAAEIVSAASGRLVVPGDVDDLARALAESLDLRDPAACRADAARYGWAETVGPLHEALYGRVRRGASRDGSA